MDNKIIINESDVYPLARENFIATGGLDILNNTHVQMLKQAERVRQQNIENIRIRALVSYFPKEVFHEGEIVIDHKVISCNYFKKIDEENIKGVYLYLLTVGQWQVSNKKNIMEALYADLWGTSYLDGAMTILRRRLESNELLSTEFGPGYFGMKVEESKKFLEILNGEEIGISISDYGLMYPEKSCTGLYFVLSSQITEWETECIQCDGNPLGCNFCKIYNKRRN